jgi:hypothetical protein
VTPELLDVLRESAVEHEIRKERERNLQAVTSRRLWAAVVLSPSLQVSEALVAGLPIKAVRLEPAWRRALKLKRDVVLDEALALRMNAHGPMEDPHGR